MEKEGEGGKRVTEALGPLVSCVGMSTSSPLYLYEGPSPRTNSSAVRLGGEDLLYTSSTRH